MLICESCCVVLWQREHRTCIWFVFQFYLALYLHILYFSPFESKKSVLIPNSPTFNVGKSTVIEAVQDVVGALYELRDDHIKFPETLAELNASIQSFEELSALPNIVGAIDSSHVRIKAPSDSAADYFSRYRKHDFIIQAVVNGKKVFTDFACGFPSSMHNACVLREVLSSEEQNRERFLLRLP